MVENDDGWLRMQRRAFKGRGGRRRGKRGWRYSEREKEKGESEKEKRESVDKAKRRHIAGDNYRTIM